MIAYLEGEIVAAEADFVVLLTSGGVGYQVRVPTPLLGRLGAARLHVATRVREDDIGLYGFESAPARRLFDSLTKINGVGPKVALAVLSALSPDALARAASLQDLAAFEAVPGVGKKIAAKICLELADKLGKGGAELRVQPAPASGPAPEGRAELVSALVNMGFQQRDVLAVVDRAGKPEDPFDARLRNALALLTSL